MMGGKFRNLMPSDLFKAGAMARESLPAAGKQYAHENNRRELKLMMRRYRGCMLQQRSGMTYDSSSNYKNSCATNE